MVSDKCRVGEGSRPSPSPLPPTAGRDLPEGRPGRPGRPIRLLPCSLHNPPPAREGSRLELNRGGRRPSPSPSPPPAGRCLPEGRLDRPRKARSASPLASVPPPPPTGGFGCRKTTHRGGRPALPPHSPLPPPAGARSAGGEAGSAGEAGPSPLLLSSAPPPPTGGGFGCTDEPGRAACPPPRPSRLRLDGIRPKGTGSAGDGPILPSLTLTLSLSPSPSL